MANLIVISGASGSGKTTLIKALLKELDNISLSVSYTERPPRIGEINGKDYYFVSVKKFKTAVAEGAFLEYAKVYGYYYGTKKNTLDKALKETSDIILEIDWQGAMQVKKHFKNAVSIAIIPPSIASLELRLATRAQDTKAVIKRRMIDACNEIEHAQDCDYIIMNRTFETALLDLKSIIISQRTTHKAKMKFIKQILAECCNNN